jgi:hypothetical protein
VAQVVSDTNDESTPLMPINARWGHNEVTFGLGESSFRGGGSVAREISSERAE